MSTVAHLVVEQGATFDHTWTWYEDEERTIKRNLTGYTAKLQIRESLAEDGTLLLELTHAAGITLGGAAGTIRVVLTPAQTETLADSDLDTLYYDLKLTSGAGVVDRFLEGKIRVKAKVTA